MISYLQCALRALRTYLSVPSGCGAKRRLGVRNETLVELYRSWHYDPGFGPGRAPPHASEEEGVQGSHKGPKGQGQSFEGRYCLLVGQPQRLNAQYKDLIRPMYGSIVPCESPWTLRPISWLGQYPKGPST